MYIAEITPTFSVNIILNTNWRYKGMFEEILRIAKAEVGKYKEGDNNDNYYGQQFDSRFWQFFNGHKNHVAYCAIFICYLFVIYFDGDLKKAAQFIGCPTNPADNCAAGVKFLHKYFKKTGAEVALTDGKPGDIIYFRNDAHVGIIEKVANGYYHTIEANKGTKSADCVARGKYKIGSSNITGITRPNYSEEEKEKPANLLYDFPIIPKRGFFANHDKGEEVKKMQKILTLICPGALPKYGIDGEIGHETLFWIEKTQKVLKVNPDRLYGPITNAAAKAYLTK